MSGNAYQSHVRAFVAEKLGVGEAGLLERAVYAGAMGYALLGTQKVEQALAVFELNTRVFPEAFNTWDSLGEAHMILGHDDDAIRFYERSLELNPDNANARAMIARIREGARPPN